MRICYVINSLDGGGGALPLPHVLAVMRAAGHDPFVVSLMERDGRARRPLEQAGIDHMVIGGATRRWAKPALRLDAIVRDRRPDTIWTSLTHATLTGELIGRLRRVPVVSWLHNAWLKPANRALLRRSHPLTRHWVADSETVARFGEAELGIPIERISIWPLFLADVAAPSARRWTDEPFRIGSLGRLHRNKGYDVLVRALAMLVRRAPMIAGRISVHLAGEGPERGALQALARDHGVANLHFEGFQDRPRDFLSTLHGYVQPSHHEGLCIAAHEAMQAGLPVIASPVGEMHRSIVRSGGGSIVPYGDAEMLASHIARLAEDPIGAHAIGQAGRTWVMAEYSRPAFDRRGHDALKAAGIG
ncbi:glycosyltransferase [Sphingomonas colocasiae]|uniref:Glycosyltransferase n=1 Tax=Sphingomonas colocasiae TaxID=1848973 RepID=A0ABS7PU98_9SPHN|nr:glycosyltransferase [Sphingomonas colocasiae]MBY8824937.1 glycosyltransferase [Sphingomonas colocasiae]